MTNFKWCTYVLMCPPVNELQQLHTQLANASTTFVRPIPCPNWFKIGTVLITLWQ